MCSVQFGVFCPVGGAAEAHSSVVFRVIRTRSVLRRWARAIPLSWKRTPRAGKVALGLRFAYLCLEVSNRETDGLTCPQNDLKSWVDTQAGGTFLITTFSLWRNRDSIHSVGTNIQELEREMVHLINNSHPSNLQLNRCCRFVLSPQSLSYYSDSSCSVSPARGNALARRLTPFPSALLDSMWLYTHIRYLSKTFVRLACSKRFRHSRRLEVTIPARFHAFFPGNTRRRRSGMVESSWRM
jgi:hypothetical protein